MNQFENFKNFNKFKGKSILAVDFGEKVVGLASFKPGIDPYPLTAGRIINKTLSQVFEELEQIVEDEIIEIIIFGIPYLLDGQESDKTKEMKNIFSMLQSRFSSIELYQQDETLTTQAAKERMLSSAEYNFQINLKKLDELSAVIILEDFIRKE